MCYCIGEVISESAEDADDTEYHADREDIGNDEGFHNTAVSTKEKAEVHVVFVFVAL